MHHPIQPLLKDDQGVLRFKKNAIVEYLLDHGLITLNDLAIINFSDEDRQQFAQLIGYSLSGYSELSYVSDDAYGAAEKMEEDALSEDKARIEYLEGELSAVRSSLREPMARLFGVHPDDLGPAGEPSNPPDVENRE
jgi:high-affinity Fe2+/Pb2+ permease